MNTKKLMSLAPFITLMALTMFGQSLRHLPALADVTVPTQPTQSPVPVVIKSDWLIDIRTVMAVGGIVLTGSWYIRGWMVKVDARLTIQDTERKALKESIDMLTKRIYRLPWPPPEERDLP